MTCEHLKDEYELHALGLSEGFEHAEIEHHLRQGCASCRAGIRNALLTNVLIMQLAPDVEVPRGLRKRVLASVGAQSTDWGWRAIWATATAALVAAVVWLGVENRQRTDYTAEAKQTLAILNGAETRQVVFGGSVPVPPQGRVLVNAKHGVLLLASNLPKPPAGQTYELWVIPKGGSPKPSGLFQSDSHGSAMYLSPTPVDVATLGAVAVTLEPAAGSTAPTSTPIIVAAMSD
ncbi:MAG: anti-sigma factor [Bryobacteraceae bacterium]